MEIQEEPNLKKFFNKEKERKKNNKRGRKKAKEVVVKQMALKTGLTLE